MHKPIYVTTPTDLSAVRDEALDALYAGARVNVFAGQPGCATLVFTARPLATGVQVITPVATRSGLYDRIPDAVNAAMRIVPEALRAPSER